MKQREIKKESEKGKCRVHNKKLIYCEDCIEYLNAIEIMKVLRLDSKEQNKAYKKALKVLK